jgi:aspartate-semialdehyde dehydrogenase
MSKQRRLRVGLVGATGVAGQQFLVALENHPWFDLSVLAASERSAGKTYRRAITTDAGGVQWSCEEPLPESFAGMQVTAADRLPTDDLDLVFSAVESSAARPLEELLAPRLPVVSTSSAFRYEDDVPILVPGLNLDHVALIKCQQRERGWRGFVAPIPNCTATGLVSALAPLARSFGLRAVLMTSLQALSGGGRSPGVLGLDILDNVIPYIPKEEEKGQRETAKILGALEGDRVVPHPVRVSVTCTRVNVRDGHTEAVFASLGRPASLTDIACTMRAFGREFVDLGLPSSPPELIHLVDDPYHPQPRVDRTIHGGMCTVVGRLREDPALDNGVKFVLVSHNTKLGAAKGAVLTAEYLVHQGLI